MTFDRKTVFAGLRSALKPKGGFTDVQITSIGVILDEFERRKLPDVRWLAYILATVWHECRFVSMREIGRGKGKPYGKPHPKTGKIYYGRGFPQITWFDNYAKFERTLNLPLTTDPDMALLVPVTTAILFEGMTTGVTAKDSFTKYQLHDCFNATVDDPVKARRIINGTDKAKTIAGYHQDILKVLKDARRDGPAPAQEITPAEAATDENSGKPEGKPGGGAGGGKAAAGGVAGAVATGGSMAAAGLPWTWIVLGAGIVAFIIFIGLLAAKKEKAT